MIEDDNSEDVAESEKSGYDSSDPKQVRERKAEAGRKDARIKATYKALLAHAHGRELVWDLLNMLGTFHDDFSSDPAILAANAARRNCGLALRRILQKSDLKMYQKMEEEHTNG